MVDSYSNMTVAQSVYYHIWAVWYITRLLIKLMPKGVVFSFLYYLDDCMVTVKDLDQIYILSSASFETLSDANNTCFCVNVL